MGKFLIAIICLVIGTGIGAMVVAPMMTGAATGIGIATGLSAGICSTVQAAQAEGLLTEAEIDQVLNRAAADIAALAGTATEGGLVGGAGECAAVMEDIRSAAGT